MQSLLGKLQKLTEGVAIGTDGVGTCLALLHQALSKETLQQCSEADGWWSWPILPALLQSAHRFAHQFGRAAQVPLGIGDVHVAKVGGQERQAALGILTGLDTTATSVFVAKRWRMSCRRGP